jgi:hypothetical protein
MIKIQESIELLEEWKSKAKDRWYSIAHVTKWQVDLHMMVKVSEDEDSDAYMLDRHSDGYHLWHVVNEVLEKWKPLEKSVENQDQPTEGD